MNPIVAGALFDFMGWLSCRDATLVVGCFHDAAALPPLLEEWAALRGLSLADVDAQSWQCKLTGLWLSKTVDDALPRRLELIAFREGKSITEKYISATVIEGYLNDPKYGNDPAWLRQNLRAELYR